MDALPWLRAYDPGVPPTLQPYPAKTLVDCLAEAARARPPAPRRRPPPPPPGCAVAPSPTGGGANGGGRSCLNCGRRTNRR